MSARLEHEETTAGLRALSLLASALADALARVPVPEEPALPEQDYVDVPMIAKRMGLPESKVQADFAAGHVPHRYKVGNGRGKWRTTWEGYQGYRAWVEEEGRKRAEGGAGGIPLEEDTELDAWEAVRARL